MATIKRKEGFKLPKDNEPVIWGSTNSKVIIRKLFENHLSYLKQEKEKQQKQNQPQPKLKLNPKKERRLIKK